MGSQTTLRADIVDKIAKFPISSLREPASASVSNVVEYGRTLLQPFKATDRELTYSLTHIFMFPNATEENIKLYLMASINCCRALDALMSAIEETSVTAEEFLDLITAIAAHLSELTEQNRKTLLCPSNDDVILNHFRNGLLADAYQYLLSTARELKAATSPKVPMTSIDLAIDEAAMLLRETDNSIDELPSSKYDRSYDEGYQHLYRLLGDQATPLPVGWIAHRSALFHTKRYWHDASAARLANTRMPSVLMDEIERAQAALKHSSAQIEKLEDAIGRFPITDRPHPPALKFAYMAHTAREQALRALVAEHDALLADQRTEDVVTAKRRARNRRKAKSKRKQRNSTRS